MELKPPEVSFVVTAADPNNFLAPNSYHSSRRNTAETNELKDLVPSRRPSGIISLHRPSQLMAQRRFLMDLLMTPNGSNRSLNVQTNVLKENHLANISKTKNRRMGK